MEDLFAIISQIHFLHDRLVSANLHKHQQSEINAAQMRILMHLWHNDKININELSRLTCLKKTTLSMMLPHLCQNGLITIDVDENDRRLRLISLTEKAIAIKEQHIGLGKQLEQEIFAGISDQDKEIFSKTLLQIKSNLLAKEKEIEL